MTLLNGRTLTDYWDPKDVKALSDLLSGNRKLELWRDVVSAGHLAELTVIENARATPAVKDVPEAATSDVKRQNSIRREHHY